MHSKSALRLVLIAMPVLGVGTSALGAVIVNSVATYDATSNTNTVDGAATGSFGSAATFTPLVATAHAANLGGVIDFELASVNPAADPAVDTVYDFKYGTSLAKTLRVTTTTSIDLVTNVDPVNGTVSALSGSGVLTNQGTGRDVGFTMTSITGSLPGEVVTDFAFTMLSRNNFNASGQDFTVTATFSGGGTQVVSTNLSNVKGGDDTFFWFKAPAGQSIVSVFADNVSATGASTPAFDDIGIITAVPEPTSIAVALIGGLGLLARRRKRTWYGY